MNTPRFIVPLLLLGTVVLGSSRSSAGQESPDSVMVRRVAPRWSIGSVSIQVGSAQLGLAELNRTLSANGRPTFSTTVPTLAVSGQARFGRFLLGGSGEMSLPRRELSAGWITKLTVGSAMLDAGYALIDGSRFLVYPQLSLGIRTRSLRMERDGDYSFDAGTQDPARGVELSTRGALAGFGLVAEVHLSARQTGEFSIGLSAGTLRPLGREATFAGESKVTGTPHEGTGHCLRLSIGKPIGKRRDALGALSTALVALVSR